MPKNRFINDYYFWKNVSGYATVGCLISSMFLHFSNKYAISIGIMVLIITIIAVLIFLVAQFMLFRMKRKKIS